MKESEKYDVFGDKDRVEFLFKVFTHITLGGPINQVFYVYLLYIRPLKLLKTIIRSLKLLKTIIRSLKLLKTIIIVRGWSKTVSIDFKTPLQDFVNVSKVWEIILNKTC